MMDAIKNKTVDQALREYVEALDKNKNGPNNEPSCPAPSLNSI